MFFLSLLLVVIKYRTLDPLEVYIMALFCYGGYNIVFPAVFLLFNLWYFKKHRSLQLGLQHLRPEYKTILLVKNSNIAIDVVQNIILNYQPEYLLIEKQQTLSEQRLTLQIKTNKTQLYLKTNIQVMDIYIYIYIL